MCSFGPPISFLFGSGADTCANEKLQSGASFSKALLTDGCKKERKSILGETKADYRLVYPTSRKVFIQSIVANEKEARTIFDRQTVDDCITYYKDNPDRECQKRLTECCKTWYKLICSDDGQLTDKYLQEQNFFLENATFFDALDEKFNSLRDVRNNANAKRVINAYFTVFVLILEWTYDIPNNFKWSYSDIFNYLCSKRQDHEKPERCQSNYYEIVRNSALDYRVITTNYTDLVDTISGKPAVHLHGKLTWFEDLDALTVYDCTEKNEREILEEIPDEEKPNRILPFILIPSGVKPLICKRQIKEFEQFIKMLEESNLLCIVGYRFNSEDNHINSIIADWLREAEHRMIYFNYGKEVCFDSFVWARDFKIKTMNYEEGEFPIRFDDGSNQIINVLVDDSTSIEAFTEFVQSVQQDYKK